MRIWPVCGYEPIVVVGSGGRSSADCASRRCSAGPRRWPPAMTDSSRARSPASWSRGSLVRVDRAAQDSANSPSTVPPVRQRGGEGDHLAHLLGAERQPGAQRGVESGLGVERVGHVQQRARRRHRHRPGAAEQCRERAERCLEVGAPDIAAVDDAGDDVLVREVGDRRYRVGAGDQSRVRCPRSRWRPAPAARRRGCQSTTRPGSRAVGAAPTTCRRRRGHAISSAVRGPPTSAGSSICTHGAPAAAARAAASHTAARVRRPGQQRRVGADRLGQQQERHRPENHRPRS